MSDREFRSVSVMAMRGRLDGTGDGVSSNSTHERPGRTRNRA